MPRPPLTSGWGWLGLFRLALGSVMAVGAFLYEAPGGSPAPGHLLPAALALSMVPIAFGLLQLTPRLRTSQVMAVAAVPVDAIVVFATLALYAVETSRHLLALVVVVQAEAGAVLGIRLGLLAWMSTSAAYLLVERQSADASTSSVRPGELVLRIGVGLILTLGGGLLFEELSGERRRRLAQRERDVGRLEEAEARYRSLLEQIPAVPYLDQIAGLGPDSSAAAGGGSTLYISPQIEALTGHPAVVWTNGPDAWSGRIHPDDRDRVAAAKARTGWSGLPFHEEYRLLGSDGRIVWVRDDATVVKDDQGRPLFRQGVLVDVTERRRVDEEVQFLAYHDPLTGLPNRAQFEDVLNLALARARRMDLAIAVLYLDLDDFKEVNDTHGHAAGDDLLKNAAVRLREAVRETDVVARTGGDEFLVLLADLSPAGPGGEPGPEATAQAVAARVHELLGEPFVDHGQELRVTTSVGISLYPSTAGDAGELLRQADTAMYRSKRVGPGQTDVFAGKVGG